MGYREGDATEMLEGKTLVDKPDKKAILFDLTLIGEVWIPRSQIVELGDPGPEKLRTIEVTKWWYDKQGW